MSTMQEDVDQFREQLRQGSIQKAYRTLLDYMMHLRAHFKKVHPSYAVSGLYQGHMDMTYFAVAPPSLKRRRLKIAVVFNYAAFRFEVWLSAANRHVLRQYWEVVKDARWPAYRLVPPGPWADSLLEYDLAEGLDVSALPALTALIEKNVVSFIDEVEDFLSPKAGRPGTRQRTRTAR